MRKNVRMILLIIILVIQICVPVGMVAYQKIDNSITEAKGEKFRFRISDITYVQGTLSFSVETPLRWGKIYADVDTDENGYAVLNLSEEEPNGDYYIKSYDKYTFDFPVTSIQTEFNDNSGQIIYLRQDVGGYIIPDENYHYYSEAYLETYVYKGKISEPTIYIDGSEINEYLKDL